MADCGDAVSRSRRTRNARHGRFDVTTHARPGRNQYRNARDPSTVHTNNGNPNRDAHRAAPNRANTRCATTTFAPDPTSRRRQQNSPTKSRQRPAPHTPRRSRPNANPTNNPGADRSDQSLTARTDSSHADVTTTFPTPNTRTA